MIPEVKSLAEMLDEHKSDSELEAMKAEIGGIDDATDDLLAIADDIEGAFPTKAAEIRVKVDHIWDSAEMLFRHGHYSREDGSWLSARTTD